jgi:hypothetical protein
MVNALGTIEMNVPFNVKSTQSWYKKIQIRLFRPESIPLTERWELNLSMKDIPLQMETGGRF